MEKTKTPLLLKIEKTLGSLEQEVMNEVWQTEKMTVREVLLRLQKEKKLAYTTVMTVMDNLYKKGFLKREKIKKTYYYSPILAWSKIIDISLKKIISDLFINYGKLKTFLTVFLLLLSFQFEFGPFYYGFILSTFFSAGFFFLIQFWEGLNLSGTIEYFNFAIANFDIFFARLPLFIQVFIESLPLTEFLLSIIFIIVSFDLFRKLKVFNKLAL